ncbi:GNAT family N-acetyltransferase [Alisedimentitalea sp. MJ-SS2]|uniref:GNAT family N-acetyltransferase n=1 Tax=Aliisedimentitalea sp. MJ-SS2 TaxID=3049795 RepID=UPI002915396B|nr:GNAT family N-acetyltransferase [Alisedimentitalea sp. MJ-SS2]MDU8927789.1 GNAT family N-acetyltransferase [Alisedimentitalea sp. MJ-SS2]
MTVSIRRAALCDSRALGAVFEAAFAAYQKAGLKIPPVGDGVEHDIRHHAVWAAEDNGVIEGGLVLSVDGAQAHLVLVAVSPSAGGKGIGTALIDTAVLFARENGVKEIRLATHRRLTQNVSLYQRLGWRKSGTEGDKVLMVRNI